MSGDEYRPREHDHLVEPMLRGLGVEPQPLPKCFDDAREPPGFVALWRRFVRALVALVRRARPRP